MGRNWTPYMITKTIILKLDSLDNDLAELLKAFSQGMNYASQIVFDIGKPIGSGQIQKATYRHQEENGKQSIQRVQV